MTVFEHALFIWLDNYYIYCAKVFSSDVSCSYHSEQFCCDFSASAHQRFQVIPLEFAGASAGSGVVRIDPLRFLAGCREPVCVLYLSML